VFCYNLSWTPWYLVPTCDRSGVEQAHPVVLLSSWKSDPVHVVNLDRFNAGE
jgi:hypothetical protein